MADDFDFNSWFSNEFFSVNCNDLQPLTVFSEKKSSHFSPGAASPYLKAVWCRCNSSFSLPLFHRVVQSPLHKLHVTPTHLLLPAPNLLPCHSHGHAVLGVLLDRPTSSSCQSLFGWEQLQQAMAVWKALNVKVLAGKGTAHFDGWRYCASKWWFYLMINTMYDLHFFLSPSSSSSLPHLYVAQDRKWCGLKNEAVTQNGLARKQESLSPLVLADLILGLGV